MLVGVISDTHGLLRPEAIATFNAPARRVEHILHAGDVGDPAILDALRAIAPVTAIRGNIDRSGACALLPPTELVELGGQSIYMLHDLGELDLDPLAAGISAIISGHSHQPRVERRKGVLYFNPGSAGPRRFSLPVSLGLLEVNSGGMEPHLVELDMERKF